jgi:pimeloyl-ACP methyl ester carboxylesterase
MGRRRQLPTDSVACTFSTEDAELVVQPGAGHHPWLDDADWFVTVTAGFLRQAEGCVGAPSAPRAAERQLSE